MYENQNLGSCAGLGWLLQEQRTLNPARSRAMVLRTWTERKSFCIALYVVTAYYFS